ncbi:MAG: insulinase family protein [bacterium]|nr:insulinase family protein [bacterium]
MLLCIFSGSFFLTATSAGSSFRLPAYEKFVMKNGLTVYLMEQHEVPLIYASVLLPAGAIKGGDKLGLASITSDALLFGTKNYTKNQIEEKLDILGATCTTGAFKETATISASFAKKDLDAVMPIVKEIIALPVFNNKEVEKRKKRLLLQLEMNKEIPGAVIYDFQERFLFGEHVYGNPTSGTRESIAKITSDDIKSFYKANYKTAESAIAVVGDFKMAEMKKKLKSWFKDWNNEGASIKVTAPKLAFDKSRVLLVNKEDATETRFLISAPGVKRSNPDYVGIQVINKVLGGGFASWLIDELRVNAGLTYNASSIFFSYKETGLFYISSYTRSAKTVEALELAVEVLGRLFKKGIDSETLEGAKNYIKGQFPPMYETSGSLASFLTNMFYYGYDESFINDFSKNVDQMTVDDAKNIIEKYFPKDKLQFVLIGKASEIRDKVKKYGEITEKEIKAIGF